MLLFICVDHHTNTIHLWNLFPVILNNISQYQIFGVCSHNILLQINAQKRSLLLRGVHSTNANNHVEGYLKERTYYDVDDYMRITAAAVDKLLDERELQ